jgi:glutathionylspermidine synthase
MISYGYQPNLADDEIIANIYANRFKTIKNSLGNTFKEVEEQHGKLKTTLKRLKRLNNERSDLIKRLSEEDRRDIYKHDQIITLLFGLNIREELIRQDIKNQIASMKFDQYSFESSIDDIVKIADDLIS